MFKTSSNSSGISSSESYGEILTNVSTASTLTNASRSAWVRVCQFNLVLYFLSLVSVRCLIKLLLSRI